MTYTTYTVVAVYIFVAAEEKEKVTPNLGCYTSSVILYNKVLSP